MRPSAVQRLRADLNQERDLAVVGVEAADLRAVLAVVEAARDLKEQWMRAPGSHHETQEAAVRVFMALDAAEDDRADQPQDR